MKPVRGLLVLLGLALALFAQAEEGWKVIDEGFQLAVPRDWRKQNVHPIDSNAGTYRGRSADLEFDEFFDLGYTTNKSQSAIKDLKKKEANSKLLKPGEEIWRVQGRLADFWSGKVDQKVYGQRRFTNVASLFIPYEGRAGYLDIYILYRSERDLTIVRRVLHSINWKPEKPSQSFQAIPR